MAPAVVMPPEELRLQFRPTPLRVLFIGESRPAGGTFFYAANSRLFEAVRSAFEAACPEPIGEQQQFLIDFQRAGCYLIDLCPEPVNHLPTRERRRRRREAVPALAGTLAELRPLAIICVMASIRPQVENALRVAGLTDLPTTYLPFPAMGHQQQFHDGLVVAITGLLLCP